MNQDFNKVIDNFDRAFDWMFEKKQSSYELLKEEAEKWAKDNLVESLTSDEIDEASQDMNMLTFRDEYLFTSRNVELLASDFKTAYQKAVCKYLFDYWHDDKVQEYMDKKQD